MFVSRVVVEDQMQMQAGRNLIIEMPQKGEKFLVSVTWFTLGNHFSIRHVERGKQSCGAVSIIIVSDAFDVTQSYRQYGLSPFQGLDLALLVYTQHQSLIGRIQIQTDDVTNLIDKEWVGR